MRNITIINLGGGLIGAALDISGLVQAHVLFYLLGFFVGAAYALATHAFIQSKKAASRSGQKQPSP